MTKNRRNVPGASRHVSDDDSEESDGNGNGNENGNNRNKSAPDLLSPTPVRP